jgi:hypothetical protein
MRAGPPEAAAAAAAAAEEAAALLAASTTIVHHNPHCTVIVAEVTGWGELVAAPVDFADADNAAAGGTMAWGVGQGEEGADGGYHHGAAAAPAAAAATAAAALNRLHAVLDRVLATQQAAASPSLQVRVSWCQFASVGVLVGVSVEASPPLQVHKVKLQMQGGVTASSSASSSACAPCWVGAVGAAPSLVGGGLAMVGDEAAAAAAACTAALALAQAAAEALSSEAEAEAEPAINSSRRHGRLGLRVGVQQGALSAGLLGTGPLLWDAWGPALVGATQAAAAAGDSSQSHGGGDGSAAAGGRAECPVVVTEQVCRVLGVGWLGRSGYGQLQLPAPRGGGSAVSHLSARALGRRA